MSRSQTGLILRGAGPLLQIVCLILLFRPEARTWSVFGQPLEMLLYAGLGIGLVLVLAGLLLYRRPPSRDPWKL